MDSNSNKAETSGVKDFYEGRSVFVTGATGFIGKVIVEKLLRTCDGIENIYVLIRPRIRAKINVRERLEEMLSSKVFDRVKKTRPNAVAKVVAIPGDIGLPDLGISVDDERLLVENVSVVFHVAAVLKFNEKLGKSVNMNVRSTKLILDLCHRMHNFASLVHVSTAYCNCDLKEVDERVYVLPQSPKQIIEAVEWMDDDCTKSIEPHLLGKRPNTYTYTKALAENVLLSERGNLPVAIIRPSIVGPAWKEPMAGWIDSLNAISMLFVGIGMGALQFGYCNPDIIFDFVPVDVCANTAIAAAWYTSTYKVDDVPVYNCTSGSTNPVIGRDGFKYVLQAQLKYPLENVYWYPSFICLRSKTCSDFLSFFIHFLPAYLCDVVMRLLGKKPFAIEMQTRTQKGFSTLEYFINNEWKFSTKNVQKLLMALSPEDKKLFNFDLRTLDWPSYSETGVLGCKIYLLKEDISRLPESKKRIKRLYYLRHIAYFVVFIFLSKLLLSIIDIL